MDDPRSDLILKELKRIKWLLVVIAFGLLVLPISVVYVGWEIVTVILQDRMNDEPEEVIEPNAEGSAQGGDKPLHADLRTSTAARF